MLNQEAIIDRIRYLIGQQRMSQACFARRLSMDPANLSKHLNGKLPLTRGFVNRIAIDVGVSRDWLAEGRGLPFDKPSPMPDVAGVPAVGSAAGVPIYDIDVTAGCTELSRQFTTDRIIGSMQLPDVSPEGVIVKVSGDSMEPDVPDGSFIAIRQVSDLSCIFWGQIYVVVLDDFRVVKRVRRHPDSRMVILRSANSCYDDMEVAVDKIRRLYMVEAILTLKLQC